MNKRINNFKFSKAKTRVQSPNQSPLTSPNQRRRIIASPNYHQNLKLDQLSPKSHHSPHVNNMMSQTFHQSQEKIYTDQELQMFNSCFLVMEYVDSDLKKVLKTVQNGTILTENHVLVILYNLICAVNFMHSSGIMHRDLKPANILINNDSQIKICDFGIAREVP